tara:strand:+ start:443 stop:643 length:201 start_codon:yes stop_codon:yes gene_type:complete
MAQVKFKDVPTGGRIQEYGKTWVVMENYDDGVIIEYTGKSNLWHSYCSFVDADAGITLETEVNFIG